MTLPSFSGSTDGTTGTTRPTPPSGGNMNGGQQGGAPANRERLGIKKGSVITVQDFSGKTLTPQCARLDEQCDLPRRISRRARRTRFWGRHLGRHGRGKAGYGGFKQPNSSFMPGQGGRPNQNGSQATVGSRDAAEQLVCRCGAVRHEQQPDERHKHDRLLTERDHEPRNADDRIGALCR